MDYVEPESTLSSYGPQISLTGPQVKSLDRLLGLYWTIVNI